MDTQTVLLIAPLVVLQVALQIYALYDIWKNQGTKGNTVVWIVVVVAFQLLGSIAYFVVGRKEA